MNLRLTPELADRFARIALGHVERDYPFKLDQVLSADQDRATPRELHPIFHGSFDWHSCVHGHWLLARLLRLFPEGAEARAIRALLDRQFTDDKVAGELAYLDRPLSAGFERPYGWAWLLKLRAELDGHPGGGHWALALDPLARAFAGRLSGYLPKLTYAIRAGTHANTAFALRLALDYAGVCGDVDLEELIAERALDWWIDDADCQAWEPSGDDFLSPALIEAECLRHVLAPTEFRVWLDQFLPRLGARSPLSLFQPAVVSDPTDGKIAHLDGLNLSRAWCWRGLASSMEPGDPRRQIAHAAADRHLEASLPAVAGDYMGEHWLASFALLALEG